MPKWRDGETIKININHISGNTKTRGASFEHSKEEKKKQLEKKIKISLADFSSYADNISEKHKSGELLNENLIGKENAQSGTEGMRKIFAEMRAVRNRFFNNNEITPELLADAEACVEKLDELCQQIEAWKTQSQEIDKVAYSIESEFDDFDANLAKYFNASEMSEEQKNEGEKRYEEILVNWDDNLRVRCENGEVSQGLLDDLKIFYSSLQNLKRDIKAWKDEKIDKEQRDEYLKNNSEWKRIFKEITPQSVETYTGTREEFHNQYSNLKMENNFPFDIREEVLKYESKTDDDIRALSFNEWERWRKMCGAAKMHNDPGKPKKLIFFEGITYSVTDKTLNKKIAKNENEARSALNKIVIERIENTVKDIAKVKNVHGFELGEKNATDLRNIAFFIGRKIIEDKDVMQRFIKDGANAHLLPEEESEIVASIKKHLESEQGVSELVIKSFVYNEISRALSKYKNLAPERKYLLQREIVDDVIANFDDANKEIVSAFIEKRKDKATSDSILEKDQKEQMVKFIQEYVDNILNERKLIQDAKKDVENKQDNEANKKEKSEKDKIIEELEASLAELKPKKAPKVEEEDKSKDKSKDKDKDKAKPKEEEKDEELEKFLLLMNDEISKLRSVTDIDYTFGRKVEYLKKRIDEKKLELEKKKRDQEAELEEKRKAEKSAALDSLTLLTAEFTDNIDKIKGVLKPKEKADLDNFLHEEVNDILHELEDAPYDDAFKRKKEDLEKRIKVKSEEVAEITKRETAVAERMTEQFGIFDRKKIARQEGQRTFEELTADLEIARKKYNEVYNEKSEKYKEILSGLGYKARYQVLMAEDKDIAFYLEDYKQILEQYLKASFEGAQNRNDELVEEIKLKNYKPSWFGKLMINFEKLLNKGSSQFIENKSPLEIINMKEYDPAATQKIQLTKEETEEKEKAKKEQRAAEIKAYLRGDQEFETDNLYQSSPSVDEKEESAPEALETEEENIDGSFEYLGGMNKLRKDLLKAMVLIVEDEKEVLYAALNGEKREKIRNLKVKDLLEGRNVKDFNRLPEEAREVIKSIARISSLDVRRRDLTLRQLVTETLGFSKTYKEKIINLTPSF